MISVTPSPTHTLADVHTTIIDLTPFSQSQEAFWKSSGLRGTKELGYTYPELVGNNGQGEATQREVAQRIEALYGTSRTTRIAAATSRGQTGPVSFLAQPPSEDAQVEAEAIPASGIWDWRVRVCVKEFELKESFQVLVFLGDVPTDPKAWMSSESYVGCVGVFVNHVPEMCGNCTNSADKVVQGAVYLDEYIAERSALEGTLEPEDVSPWVKERLAWRVRKVRFSFSLFSLLLSDVELGRICRSLAGRKFPCLTCPRSRLLCSRRTSPSPRARSSPTCRAPSCTTISRLGWMGGSTRVRVLEACRGCKLCFCSVSVQLSACNKNK